MVAGRQTSEKNTRGEAMSKKMLRRFVRPDCHLPRPPSHNQRRAVKLAVAATVVSITLLAIGVTLNATSAVACDAQFVSQQGRDVIVQPTGSDDTGNIQCAFDLAVASGSVTNVRLRPGAFYTAQIAVSGFNGEFAGAGVKETIVFNLPDLYVNKFEWYMNEPSATNPWPSLFSFVGGDLRMSGLAIHIQGDNPTQGWGAHSACCIDELGIVIAILGGVANASISNVLIEGERSPDGLYGLNVINGIAYEGFFDYVSGWSNRISGRFSVEDSAFRRVASGTLVGGLDGASVLTKGSSFDEVRVGGEAVDLISSSWEFSNNSVSAVFGVHLYNLFDSANSGGTVVIHNNIFRGKYGPVIGYTDTGQSSCLLLGNNVQQVTNIGIYLDNGASGCTVVGGNTKSNVLDLGTKNVLAGVSNMGSGVGSMIQDVRQALSDIHSIW